jgi:hypothetical protein
MIGFKQTILELKQALDVDVVNQDGAIAKLWLALYNGQPEREKDGSGYTYKKPALFIEPIFSDGLPIGNGASSYELKFKLLLQIEHLNSEGTFDENLSIFDLKDKIHRVLNSLKLSNCSPLFQSNKVIDVNHGNQYLAVLEYSTHFIDLTGTIYDQLNDGDLLTTLTNPQLIFDGNTVTVENILLTEDLNLLTTEDNNTILYE